jgi:hypothetical protein
MGDVLRCRVVTPHATMTSPPPTLWCGTWDEILTHQVRHWNAGHTITGIRLQAPKVSGACERSLPKKIFSKKRHQGDPKYSLIPNNAVASHSGRF